MQKLPVTLAKAEAPLAAVLSAQAFPGRTALRCDEVARVVRCTSRHVLDLCIEGTIRNASNLASDPKKTRETAVRIPVADYDAWIKRRSNIPELQAL